jgi:ubiquinol-cytochrome c reductase cytochrome b subunit
MWRFVTRRTVTFDDEQRRKLELVLDAVAAEAQLPGVVHSAQDSARIAEGRVHFADPDIDCAQCHTFGAFGDGDRGPDLTGWGSRDWILGMLHDPTEERFYGDDNDRMPSFGVDQSLTDREMGLIADWLRGDWYEPVAAQPEPGG